MKQTNFKNLTDTELEIYISNPDTLYTEAAKAERERRINNPIGTSLTIQDSSVTDLFNCRTEVSADAKYIAARIIKHLWIISIFLPIAIALLWLIIRKVIS